MDKEDRITRFKSCRVGKGRDLRKKIKKLPEDMQLLWTKRNFRGFLKRFSTLLSDSSEGVVDDLKAILPFLPELSMSYDRGIHLMIDDCYLKCKDFAEEAEDRAGLKRTLACSSNDYLCRTITENCKIRPFFGQSLALSSHLLTTQDIVKQTYHVENPDDERCLLISLHDFIKKLYVYPLDLRILRGEASLRGRPGVYLIFYIGKEELYPGSQVDALFPVYVGKSETDINGRLADHLKHISNAKKLNVTDFVFKFMTVDGKDLGNVGKIELTLIEYFSPIWNTVGTDETPRFSFGNAADPKSSWNKCHIQEDKETLDTMVKRLSIKDNGPENEA